MWSKKFCFCITSCQRNRNDNPESEGSRSSGSGKRRSKSRGNHERKEKVTSIGQPNNYAQLDSGGRAANTDAGASAAAVMVATGHVSDMGGSACGSFHGGDSGGDGGC
ncbi:Uncharacterized protein Adt_39522 [Abeliophyllum distichum]|uniref:Uncharacterized protein n=1 Tax=Abeliophyllum distichum TaxID=126358 RepID=A0ABD1Q9I8_9LAMI